MSARIVLVVAALPLALAGAAPGNGKATTRPAMPIDVTPLYESNGPRVAVGEYSKRLADANADTIVGLCDDLTRGKDRLRPEVMYVAAIRLYDLGRKDDAVYWFYTAQYRGRVFDSVLEESKVGGIGSDAFESKAAYAAFNQLAGEYINGYAFGDPPKLEATLAKVRDEGKSMPNFADLYPNVSFIDPGKWAEQNKEVSDGLGKLIDQIKNNEGLIKQKRKENGIDGKY